MLISMNHTTLGQMRHSLQLYRGKKKVHITQLERLLEIESSEQEKWPTLNSMLYFLLSLLAIFQVMHALYAYALHTTYSEVCVL